MYQEEETVTRKVIRPIKVIALICGFIAVVLMIVAIAGTGWLSAEGYKQGLWEECVWEEDNPMVCQKNPSKAWIDACAALCIITLLVVVGATVLNGLGLLTKDMGRKNLFYLIAFVLDVVGLLFLLISLIVFPVMFLKEMNERGKDIWYFEWAYGIAWGAFIFIVAAAVLLFIDKESDELSSKTTTYYSNYSNA